MWRYLRLILPRPAAALGAALCALWPLHIAYAGFFTSETPGLAFLVLSLWLAERSVRFISTRDGLLAGLAGGMAAAIRHGSGSRDGSRRQARPTIGRPEPRRSEIWG